MKRLNEAGSVAIGGGNFNSSGPPIKRKVNKYFSGYNGGGAHRSADDEIGGAMGLGRTFPVDYFDDYDFSEMDEEEFDKLLQEGVFSKALDIGQSLLYSIPVFGDTAAALKFLYTYFGPYGLRHSTRRFTRILSTTTKVKLGNDFLEPEGIDIPEEEFTGRLSYAMKKFSNLDVYKNVDNSLTFDKIQEILDRYDAILDNLRAAFIAFFGAVDAIGGQFGFFTNSVMALTEPEDFINWLVFKYSDNLLPKIKKIMDKTGIIGDLVSTAGKIVSLPLDFAGNLDLFFNAEKLERFAIVHRGLSALKSKADKLQGAGEEGKVNKILKIVLDKVLEENKNYNLCLLMEEYLNKEESFEEIDLEEIDLEEISAGGVAGSALPIGQKTKKFEEAINEQIERMRILEAYHQKTSNRLK